MKHYITTSIAYVNGAPHIGFAQELVIADAIARWQRAKKREVFFATGTDEHGTKIERKAKQSGLTPKQFTDKNAERFQELTDALNISNDTFIRTTDKGHKAAAQAMWDLCKEDLYKKTYKGLYCVGCESFVTETSLVDGKCPNHPNMDPEEVEEENWFFRLSKYSEKILQAVKSGELEVLPETRRNEILRVLEDGLEDISVSRSKKALKWGVPVPGDDSQVMYVWFDALTNYLSAVGFPDDKYETWWPADTHVIGKDIIRHHVAIWPGMLLSAGLPLPKRVCVHGFINVDGRKMSKSLGNVVDPFAELTTHPIDAVRYYLLREIPSDEDGDYSGERFAQRYNVDLANDLGNLVSRVTNMVEKAGGSVNEIKKVPVDFSEVEKKMEQFKVHEALAEIWNGIVWANRYIDEKRPWEKKGTTEELKILSVLVRVLKDIATELEPFLPDTAQQIHSALEAPIKKAKPLFPKA